MMKFRLVPQLDQYPLLVSFAQTWRGKFVVWGVFSILLCIYGERWWSDVSLLLLCTTLLGNMRMYFLPLASLVWLIRHLAPRLSSLAHMAASEGVSWLTDSYWYKPALIASVILFCWIFTSLSHRFRRVLPFSRPLITLSLLYVAAVLVLSFEIFSPLVKVMGWGFIIILGRYFWFLAYGVSESRQETTRPFTLQFGQYFPFWCTYTLDSLPLKGGAYLKRIEARTPQVLAVCQLKAIKLLWWAILLRWFISALLDITVGMPWIFEHYLPITFSLGLPTFPEAYRNLNAGMSYPIYVCWLSLILDVFMLALRMAEWGHVIVAICRMSGFMALRNTYKPFFATSIIEYWNRLVFYFKELLVDHYFYPAFLRYFKSNYRARLFFATFAAAGVGNWYAHMLLAVPEIPQHGFLAVVRGLQNYLFYVIILSFALWRSQLKAVSAQASNKAPSWFRQSVVNRSGVLLFYTLLHVFDEWRPGHTVARSFHYLLYLFGLS